MFLPCARNAILNRKDMMPIDPHTSNAEMPVIFKSHVNTTPSPHMVVRKVTNDMVNATLSISVTVLAGRFSNTRQTYSRAGTGTPLLLTQPKIPGAWPDLANDNSILELA
jgi:hypothetical protein